MFENQKCNKIDRNFQRCQIDKELPSISSSEFFILFMYLWYYNWVEKYVVMKILRLLLHQGLQEFILYLKSRN